MSGRRQGGAVWGVVTAFLALGCCLLSAPAAHADLDDLFDTVIGAADGADPGAIPDGSADLADLGVLNDPLAQLDQVFHETPGPAAATPGGVPMDAGSGVPTGGTPDSAPGTEHGDDGGSSHNLPNVPKFSMPGSGSGGSGGSGGGPGGSGGSGNPAGATKARTTTSATGAPLAPPQRVVEP